jgi:hypothetical protein
MANFPDLNDDGKVTRADVLKGRGVFKKGGKVKKMRKFEEGGEIQFETMRGRNPNIIDEDTRIRAMDYAQMMQEPMPEIETKEAPKAKPKAKLKKEVVYSPKSLPESDREENSAFMRQFRKDEAASKKSPFGGKTSSFAGKTSSFKKMASGGKVSSASKRADGCAIRGKTRA